MDCGWFTFSPHTYCHLVKSGRGSLVAIVPSFLSSLESWCCNPVCEPRSMKRDYVFIVNPCGANGKTGNQWKSIYPRLTAELSDKWNVRETFTSRPSHATEIAREAIREGAAAVIAVGGDGTLHEKLRPLASACEPLVVNGFFEDGKLVQPKEMGVAPDTALGLIPLGTGSDFARTFNWKNNSLEAIERIGKGQRQKIDVAHVVLPSGGVDRYFINVADIHLSAKGGYYAAKYKKLGTFCYVAGALHGFASHKNQDFDIRIDDGEWELLPKVTTVAVGNAKYYGGGMKITPTADPFSNDLEVVILQRFKWYDFLFQAHKLYNGSHVEIHNVSVRRAHTIEIRQHLVNPEVESKQKIFIQADGEHLGFLPAKFSILPGVIDFLV